MMNNRRRIYWYIGIGTAVTFTAIVYTVELLTAEPVFSITSFSLNYAVSFPFILLSVVINCGTAALLHRPALKKRSVALRIAFGGMSAVVVAVLLVIVGNLPFIPDMTGYVRTVAFWRSVGATTLINVIILASAELMVQAVINRNLQNENAVLQYRQLKSQINPHFLFNSLNVLVSLINKDREAAVKYTKKLSAVYRYVLTQDCQDTVTVREEMDFIGNYIGILKTRFSEGLEFRCAVRDEDMTKSVPPMSLQLLIENAVKHNAVMPENPLVISVASDGKYLSVANSIRPRMSRSEGTGIGLKNLSEKYEILAQRDICIAKDDDSFTVKLPLL